jgi:O-succinylbenzoate synthase
MSYVSYEDEIRADERAKCIRELEAYAQAYVEKWTRINPSAEDQHKADAFNIMVAAASLRAALPQADAP